MATNQVTVTMKLSLDNCRPQVPGLEPTALDNAVNTVTADNLDLGCRMIEKAAHDKAVTDIDARLAAGYAVRFSQLLTALSCSSLSRRRGNSGGPPTSTMLLECLLVTTLKGSMACCWTGTQVIARPNARIVAHTMLIKHRFQAAQHAARLPTAQTHACAVHPAGAQERQGGGAAVLRRQRAAGAGGHAGLRAAGVAAAARLRPVAPPGWLQCSGSGTCQTPKSHSASRTP